MKKIEICNSHTNEVATLVENLLPIEFGETLRNVGDGRYYGNSEEEYAPVYVNDYDEDGELSYGELIGFVGV